MQQLTPSFGVADATAAADEQAVAARILVVDDEHALLTILARYLRGRGFDVATAECGEAALDTLGRAHYDLMLCDVRMPGISGADVVGPALALDEDLGIVMLSAVNDAPTAADVMSQGALDYLTKPIELEQLYAAVSRALHKRTLLKEQRRVERAIRVEVVERTKELEREKTHLRELTVSVVETLVTAMEAKDVYQRGHSARVADLGASIAEYMGLAPDIVEDVRLAGRLHDVGNIGVREEVLNKPVALSPDEFDLVKSHVRIGVAILSPLKHIDRAMVFVSEHHEHWDGSGYPQARSGDQISIGARILAAADAYDSLTSPRAYRESVTPSEAVQELGRCSGTLLDPRVYEALRVVVSRRKSLVFIDAIHA
jgi:response regulator RpfG family c-di-GMP phosphodiesterase